MKVFVKALCKKTEGFLKQICRRRKMKNGKGGVTGLERTNP